MDAWHMLVIALLSTVTLLITLIACCCGFNRDESVFLCVYFGDTWWCLAPIRVHKKSVFFFRKCSTRYFGFSFIVTHVVVMSARNDIAYEPADATQPMSFELGVRRLVPAWNTIEVKHIPEKAWRAGPIRAFIFNLCMAYARDGLIHEYGADPVPMFHAILPPSQYEGMIGYVFVHHVKEIPVAGRLGMCRWSPIHSVFENAQRKVKEEDRRVYTFSVSAIRVIVSLRLNTAT